MPTRWTMLCVLFFARMTMAFQFQAIPALAPEFSQAYGVTLGGIGFLIGLYLAPGIVVAIPGGAIAARLGDRLVVGTALAIMFAGSALVAWGPVWEVALAGRLIAGTGGVIVNVVMTKMVVDWFTGREMSTALALFVNSWPVGIALALLVLPPVAEYGALPATHAATLTLVGIALVLFATLYRPAPGAPAGSATISVQTLPVLALGFAALVWALYNAALAMIFGFGALALRDLGWGDIPASALIAGVMTALAASLPFGGAFADWSGRKAPVILLSLASFGVLCPLVPILPATLVPLALIGAGALYGLAGGPIMSLPAHVLVPESRAFGMGVFFTVYYAVMLAAPSLAGAIAERAGSTRVIFAVAAALALAALLSFWLFLLTARRHTPTEV